MSAVALAFSVAGCEAGRGDAPLRPPPSTSSRSPAPSAPTAPFTPPPVDPALQQRLLRAFDPRAAGDEARPLAPHFVVESTDPGVDKLPLAGTRADVRIAGAVADVTVTQVYKNQGTRPIEAVYVFPASTRAAVHAMKMTVGQRVIEAVIREKQAAREEYDEARRSGRTASLLEQQRPNVFKMRVANILPGDEITVQLSYVELLVPEEQVYEFVFPTVVGPRYHGAAGSGEGDTDEGPHLKEGASAPHTFALDATVQGALPLRGIASPSHAVAVEYSDGRTARVKLPADKAAADRDFVLRYSLAGGAVESGLLLQRGDGESFFMLTLEPPARVAPRAILPREYIFIVDVSGSMSGFPLEVSKKLMNDLLGQLRPEDRFNVLLFAGGSSLLAEQSLPATPPAIARAADLIDFQHGGGGTELLPALDRALALPRDAQRSRIVVVVTDGFVTVEKEAFEKVRRQLGAANLFAFGIGTSVNRHLIEGLARAGQGEPFVITSQEEAPRIAERFRRYVAAPLVSQMKLRFEGIDESEVEPRVLPDLFAERPLVVTGRLRGAPSGRVVISGRMPDARFEQTVDLAGAAVVERGPLPQLWARQRIARLGDEGGEDGARGKDEITRLGLAYHLMTEHTSFVAVDRRVRGGGKDTPSVNQPSPLPAGVSEAAVEVGGAESSGESYGIGGLGLIGTGRGGGGVARAYVLDSIGSGPGSGSGYGVGLGTIGTIGTIGTSGGGLRGRAASTSVTTPGGPMVMGSLDKEIIRRVIRRHMSEVRFCYEKQLAISPGLTERLTVRFVIGPTGAVTSAAISASTAGNAALEQCVVAAFKRWTFPSGAGNVIVNYPLQFAPSN